MYMRQTINSVTSMDLIETRSPELILKKIYREKFTQLILSFKLSEQI